MRLVLLLVSKLALFAALNTANAASIWNSYQPETPKCLLSEK